MLDTPTLEYAYSLYSCTSAIYSREKFEHCIQRVLTKYGAMGALQ